MVFDKQYYTYIMTNKNSTVLYAGMTNDLKRRIYEHKNDKGSSFTQKYNTNKLVYFEIFRDVKNAIIKEKKIKGGPRKKKIDLIEKENPEWKDLYEDL